VEKEYLTIPTGITSIQPAALRNTTVKGIIFPPDVMDIGNYAFNYCTLMQYYDFSNHSTIPTLQGIEAFTAIPSNCKIIVPDSLYDAWIAATNWGEYASYIIKKSDWEAQQATS
jgi:hypothetical protein